MKINKKILLELGVADKGLCVKQDTIVEENYHRKDKRWSTIREVFFAYKDKFYRTEYKHNAEYPWGHRDDEIECAVAKLQEIPEWTVPQWVIKN